MPTASGTVRQVIREAIAWAAVEGYRVRIGSYGVHKCGPRWERDPREGGIDPLGAVLLKYQPATAHLPDAPAECLGVSIPCIEGIRDGLEKKQPGNAWGPKVWDYLGGYQIGSLLRNELLHNWVVAPIAPTVH